MKIKKYITDTFVSLSDRLLGNDAEDDDKTKNYTIQSIVDLVLASGGGNANHSGDVTGDTALTIASKAVDVAMLADGTDGELITWSATGVATTVPVGTATEVLTSNGVGVAPTFQAGGGGGASEMRYFHTGWVDAGGTTQWYGVNDTDLSYNEYNIVTNFVFTTSCATITVSNLLFYKPFFIANGNQTIDSLILKEHSDKITHISIIKVNWTSTSYTTVNYQTVLFEGAISIDAGGNLTIPSGSFTETSISDGDVIFMFFGSSSTSDAPFTLTLKTTID